MDEKKWGWVSWLKKKKKSLGFSALFTFCSDRMAGRFRSLTFGNSGSSVPSLERGEYATVCLVTSFLPVSFTQAPPFLEYITS